MVCEFLVGEFIGEFLYYQFKSIIKLFCLWYVVIGLFWLVDLFGFELWIVVIVVRFYVVSSCDSFALCFLF